MRRRILSLLRRPATGDMVFLYGSFAANYLFPLFLIPFLTRTLGPTAWGQYVVAESFSNLIAIILNLAAPMRAPPDSSPAIAMTWQKFRRIHTELIIARRST